MNPKAIIERALGETFRDGAGHTGFLELDPPLTVEELGIFDGQQPAPLPADICELLQFSRGFVLLGESVDFRGEIASEFEPPFPWGLPLYSDGVGQFWMVHVHPRSGAWAPIFFTSADPPVVVVQSPDLAHFLEEWFNRFRPRRSSALDQVYQTALDIWHRRLELRPAGEVRTSADPILRAFAEGLKEEALIVDLRNAKVGSGFAWGCFGSQSIIKRHGPDLVFAVEKPERRPFFSWLRGRADP